MIVLNHFLRPTSEAILIEISNEYRRPHSQIIVMVAK